MSFYNRFRRVTYSTEFLPQIDGLRFLAIFSVAVIMHITNYMNEKFYGGEFIVSDFWRNFVYGGGYGVSLFFVISGFILSLPFARWRLKGDKKISLRNYYLRRVTRLEPPYLIALMLLFIIHVWVIQRFTFSFLWPHLVASSVYLHGQYFKYSSPVLPIAWSLEVEVQFYVLAPLFFLIFRIANARLRRLIYLLVIAGGSFYWYDIWRPGHVFMYLHFFFSGMLLADLYCTNQQLLKNKTAGLVIGSLSLLCFLFLPWMSNPFGYGIRILSMILLTHIVLTNPYLKKLFSIKGLVIIGGMCYSIYLLHFALIAIAGSLFIKWGWNVSNPAYFFLYSLLLTFLVLVFSALFFIWVERPFMKPMGLNRKKNYQ